MLMLGRFWEGVVHRAWSRRGTDEVEFNSACMISVKNDTDVAMQLFFDDQGPVATARRKSTTQKVLPPRQLSSVRYWSAVMILHGHAHTVTSGLVSDDMRKRCIVNIPSAALNERMLGMSTGAYFRLVQAQLHWRRHLLMLAAARARRRHVAASHICRKVRAYLHRTPRTCFVCLDTVRWDEMVTLVPNSKCHRTCRSCASRHVDIALTDGRMHVRCPGAGCKHLLPKSVINELGSPDARKHWQQNQRVANARRANGLVSDDKLFLQFCSQHARICPGCSVIIYRHSGCNHMTCHCGFEFDWASSAEAKISPDGGLATASSAANAASSMAHGHRHNLRRMAPRTRTEEQAQMTAAIAESIEIHTRDTAGRATNDA
mmetsp:Transcript_11347/g.29005  ORF Transcript_11347/g.29005 Transcript_11347/m.29005 type:complete len:375 (+) Transcript_11347:39-1163(+)